MEEARSPPMSRDDRSPVHATIRINGSSENGRLGSEDGGRYAVVSKHTCRAALSQLFQMGVATSSPLMIIRPCTRICARHRCSVFESYRTNTDYGSNFNSSDFPQRLALKLTLLNRTRDATTLRYPEAYHTRWPCVQARHANCQSTSCAARRRRRFTARFPRRRLLRCVHTSALAASSARRSPDQPPPDTPHPGAPRRWARCRRTRPQDRRATALADNAGGNPSAAAVRAVPHSPGCGKTWARPAAQCLFASCHVCSC
jgi:hypothetical protein